MLQAALEKWGYEVLMCSDGLEAWNELQRTECPKLAMLDWMMPEMDGPTICRRLREDSDRPYTYVILFTSKDRREDLLKGLDAGADDYLIKPFDRTELKLRLRIGERIVRLQDQLIQARDDFQYQASHDPLTGLYNRRVILDRLEGELGRAIGKGGPLSVAVADVDNFKTVNDNYGHLVGDGALVEVSQTILGNLPENAVVGRYGGEEFIIVMPGFSLKTAFPVVEKVRKAVSGKGFTNMDQTVNITLSVGIAEADHHRDITVDDIIKAADSALYAAKRNGRNRVESSAALLETQP
jgi:diguanylate cyclase (GGDEF)-like protein